jgi:hypothetical protein
MTKAIFLRKSKNGNHVFAFAGNFNLVMPIEEISELIEDKREWVKVSVVNKDE